MENCFYAPAGYKVKKKEVYFVYDEDGCLLGEFYEPVGVKELEKETVSIPRLEAGMFGCTDDGDCFAVTVLENERIVIYQSGGFDSVEEIIECEEEGSPKIDYLFKGIKSFEQVEHFIRMLEGGRRDVVGDKLVWSRFYC
jgi:hypothetical protein